ncbi:Lar family restriction alleviation protein [Marinobacter sp.]|uniref:Lar family restriction alleviation protein n=1 Tax=Marinobacter sp. TaxID=50741 RepID=UPI003A915627
MSIELKPCPFCGGEAEMMGDQYPYVECQECNVNFSANHSYEFDQDDAASNWNSRRFGQDKMKRIAESKVRQLGGDVCGVLVRKGEKLAAVDEHGRVMWLDSWGEAARAQGDAEPESICPRCKGKGRHVTGPIDCPAIQVCRTCSETGCAHPQPPKQEGSGDE